MKKKKTFRSKLEESVADILDKVGAVYEYETHKVAYTIQHHYNPRLLPSQWCNARD